MPTSVVEIETTTAVAYHCPICERKYSNSSGAWQHYFVFHDESIKLDTVEKEWKREQPLTKDDCVKEGDIANKSNGGERQGIISTYPRVKCPMCCEMIASIRLKAHRFTHLKPKVKCDHCNAWFATAGNLRHHKKRAHSSGAYDTTSVSDHPSHSNNNDGTSQIVVGDKEKNATPIEVHTISLETGERVLQNADERKAGVRDEGSKCPDCCEMIASFRLFAHKVVHRNPKVKCDHCHGQFATAQNLYDHKKRAHSSVSNHPPHSSVSNHPPHSLVSHHPPQSSVSNHPPHSLVSHHPPHSSVSNHPPQSNNKAGRQRSLVYQKRVKCSDCCEIIFRNRLVIHKLAHRNPTVKCKRCHGQFTTANDLHKHTMKTHNNNKQEKYKGLKCPDCCEIMTTPSRLIRHRIVHLNATIKCVYCLALFRTKHNLQNHRYRVHIVTGDVEPSADRPPLLTLP